MTELRTCSRCKSTIDISYFGVNRKKEPHKTCDNCRNKRGRIMSVKNKKNMPIDATDIAIILGLNKYRKDYYDVVVKYWKRIDMKDFDKIYIELVKEEELELYPETGEDKIINTCMEQNISYDFEELADVSRLQEELTAIGNLDEVDIIHFCNTQMGKQFEEEAKKRYENQTGEKIETVENYSKRLFHEDDYMKWFVGGRIDGITQDTRKIIEIKNRRKHIYPCIPLYEVIQVYTYMYIFETDYSILVENCNNEINETNFIYNDSYETFILSKLKSFCTFMNDFMNDHDLKMLCMKSNFGQEPAQTAFNNIASKHLPINSGITFIRNLLKC